MKVYLAASMRGAGRNLQELRKVVEELKKSGLEVLTEAWILNEVLDVDRGVPPEEIFERDLKALDDADVVLADVNFPSLGVGFEIAYALLRGKRVVAFCREDRARKLSALILGITWPNFELVTYSTVENLVTELLRRLFD